MENIRTQIYIRKDQDRLLRDEAHRLRIPITELIRQALDSFLIHVKKKPASGPRGLAAITGIVSSGFSDGSTRYEEIVADAIAEDIKKERSQKPRL